MPVDFECQACALRFSVGWYHYHDLSSGYGASTLAACIRCGAQHQIELAMNLSNAPAFFSFFDVTIEEVPPSARLAVMSRLRELRGLALRDAKRVADVMPIVLARDVAQHRAMELEAMFGEVGAPVQVTETRREPVGDRPSQQHDRLLIGTARPGATVTWHPLEIKGERAGITGTFDLGVQSCGHCSAVGTLMTEHTSVPPSCPRCRSPIKEVGGWVT